MTDPTGKEVQLPRIELYVTVTPNGVPVTHYEDRAEAEADRDEDDRIAFCVELRDGERIVSASPPPTAPSAGDTEKQFTAAMYELQWAARELGFAFGSGGDEADKGKQVAAVAAALTMNRKQKQLQARRVWLVVCLTLSVVCVVFTVMVLAVAPDPVEVLVLAVNIYVMWRCGAALRRTGET